MSNRNKTLGSAFDGLYGRASTFIGELDARRLVPDNSDPRQRAVPGTDLEFSWIPVNNSEGGIDNTTVLSVKMAETRLALLSVMSYRWRSDADPQPIEVAAYRAKASRAAFSIHHQVEDEMIQYRLETMGIRGMQMVQGFRGTTTKERKRKLGDLGTPLDRPRWDIVSQGVLNSLATVERLANGQPAQQALGDLSKLPIWPPDRIIKPRPH